MTEIDDRARRLVEQVLTETDYDAVVALIAELDAHLFATMCAKPYLDEPDPGPTCSPYLAGTCGYVNAIRAVREEFGINVSRRSRGGC